MNQRIKILLEKYLSNTLEVKERAELMTKLEPLSNEEVAHILGDLEPPEDYISAISENEMIDRLDGIKDALFEQNKIRTMPSRPKEKLYIWKVAVAACFLMAIGWSLYYWGGGQQHQDTLLMSVKEDIDPAKPTALITLANGETIQIDSTAVGLIYSKAGLNVYKSKEGEILYRDSSRSVDGPSYLTIHTPKGGFTKLKLDDGTVVELNAASSIRYPTGFDADKREVYVEGEAFFDVQPDKDRPFRVHSHKQVIEVLGTSFNLISSEQYAKTTLIEGRVKIVAEGKDYFLKPGQQAMVSDRVEIKEIHTASSVGWKNEKFIFDNSSFKETLREVENWYDVRMVFFDENLDNVQLSGTVSRNVKLSELLKVLEMNTNYKFEIEGRRVLVRRY